MILYKKILKLHSYFNIVPALQHIDNTELYTEISDEWCITWSRALATCDILSYTFLNDQNFYHNILVSYCKRLILWAIFIQNGSGIWGILIAPPFPHRNSGTLWWLYFSILNTLLAKCEARSFKQKCKLWLLKFETNLIFPSLHCF